MDSLQLLSVGFAFMILVMAGLWWTHGRRGNAGVVDVAWGSGVGLLSVFYCVFSFSGDPTRRITIATLAALWSVRLSLHIWHRVMTMEEDGRYLELKAQWGSNAGAKMFQFFMFQAIAATLFSVPMLIGAASAQAFGWLDITAIFVWIFAISGETLSDRQLQKFREAPSNKGKTCRSGVWYYSRHPNYFFEWIHWFSYVFLAVSAPFGWLTILAPFAMLYFILFVTGIPPTEKQSIKSRGQDYLDYQKTTSAFFPWPPKRS